MEIEGYGKSHIASKSSKVGTANVKNNFDTIERCDLNNIVCGSNYIHPHNKFDEFYKYFEMCLGSLAKENKEVYMWWF